MRKSVMLLAAILGLCLILASESFGQTLPSKKDWTAEVSVHVTRLASKSPDERIAAADWLLNSDPAALPAIEDATKTLTPESESGRALHGLLEKLRPLAKARAAHDALRDADESWNYRKQAEDYDRFGQKNPRWDDAAKQAMRKYVARLDEQKKGAKEALLEVTQKLGCGDALVWYYQSRALQNSTDPRDLQLALRSYLEAMPKLHASAYPAYRKAAGIARYLEFMTSIMLEKEDPHYREMDEKMLAELQTLFPAALREEGLPKNFAIDLARETLGARVRFGEDRAKALDDMLPSMEKAFPPGNLALVFAGHAYIDWAWDARGGDIAANVPAEGFKLFAERLAMAEKLLTEAYQRNPSDSAAATAMITVEMGLGVGREQMESWFNRAISANPENFADSFGYSPYNNKLLYLQPKWHGSPAECLAFGRECAATRNYRDNVSWVLIDALKSFANSSGDEGAFWHNPAAWAAVRNVVLPPVNAEPDSFKLRTKYALWAYKCGQWKVAEEQLTIVGDKLDATIWPKIKSDAARLDLAQRKGDEKPGGG